jgi:hypothetical protein
MHADAVGLPGAQRVAAFRVLDLQHLRAEIGELETDHVAGNEPRHVDHAHAVERTGRSELEGFLGHTHWSALIPKGSGSMPHLSAATEGNKAQPPAAPLLLTPWPSAKGTTPSRIYFRP